MTRILVSRNERSPAEYKAELSNLMGELEDEILGRLDAVSALMNLEEGIKCADSLAFAIAQPGILFEIGRVINLLTHRP